MKILCLKKKTFTTILSAVLCLSVFAGCGTSNQTSSTASSESVKASSFESVQVGEAKPLVRVGALKGPTGLGLVDLMERNENKKAANIYEFTLAASPDEISGKLVSGELNIACVPTNMAAVLYGKTQGQVKLIGVNTLGVLYLLEKTTPSEESASEDEEQQEGSIHSIADLSGKTVYTTGQGSTQEYVLNYLLRQNNITDAEVVFKSEHAELASLMVAGEAEYALLPQPFVTTVTTKDPNVRVALDITKEWENASSGKPLPMGCVVVRSDFLEKNKPAVDSFLQEMEQSIDNVNQDVAYAAALAGKFEIIDEAIAKKAIPQSNIACIVGEDMKTSVSSYLEVLYQENPQSIGGALPDDAFYYIP